MINKLLSIVVTLGIALGLSGCIVHARPRACGYGYYWNGYRCALDFQSRRYHPIYHPLRRTVILRDHR